MIAFDETRQDLELTLRAGTRMSKPQRTRPAAGSFAELERSYRSRQSSRANDTAELIDLLDSAMDEERGGVRHGLLPCPRPSFLRAQGEELLLFVGSQGGSSSRLWLYRLGWAPRAL